MCQQLRYLCESAVQSDNIPCESSSGVSICLVMRLKRSPHLSRVCRSQQFSCRMLETPFWKGAFRIDSRLGCFLPPFETVLSCKWMLSSARIYFDASPMLPQQYGHGKAYFFPVCASIIQVVTSMVSWCRKFVRVQLDRNWKSSNFRAFSFLDTGSSWFQPIHASKNSWLFSMMQFIRYTS